MAYLRREKKRCERRLDELRRLLANAAQRMEHAEVRNDRSTAGWTEEKRLAVSRRMRAYWAARRTSDDEVRASDADDRCQATIEHGRRPPMPNQAQNP